MIYNDCDCDFIVILSLKVLDSLVHVGFISVMFRQFLCLSNDNCDVIILYKRKLHYASTLQCTVCFSERKYVLSFAKGWRDNCNLWVIGESSLWFSTGLTDCIVLIQVTVIQHVMQLIKNIFWLDDHVTWLGQWILSHLNVKVRLVPFL